MSIDRPDHAVNVQASTAESNDHPNPLALKRAMYGNKDVKPNVSPPEFDDIPAAMRTEGRWVLWRLVWAPGRDGGGKWTKVPYRANGRKASSTAVTTWTTFNLAQAAFRQGGFDGVGFVLGGGWAGVDLDGVGYWFSDFTAEAQELICRFRTYAEQGPSQTGAKLFGRGTWNGDWHKKVLPGGGEIEVYGDGRFFTVTGEAICPGGGDGYPVADIQAALDELAARFADPHMPAIELKPTPEPETGPAVKTPSVFTVPVSGVPADDDALLAKIRTSDGGPKFVSLFDRGELEEYAGDWNRADLGLCCILAFWTGRDADRIDRLLRRSKLFRDKWDSKRRGTTYGARTIEKAVAFTTEVYDPAGGVTFDAAGGTKADDPGEGGTGDEGADAADAADAAPPIEKGEGGGAAGGKKKKRQESAADVIVKLAHAAKVSLFHTGDQEPFAQVPRGKRLEVSPVRGTAFRRILAGLYFDVEKKGASGEAMATAISTLEAIACFQGKELPVHLRTAPHPDGGIVLDLCDDAWRCVAVRPGGWEVLDDPVVMFRRSPTMLPLPVPERGGSLDDLRKFLNLKSDDEWLLTAAWLCAACRPAGPYPVLHPKGEQGTAKTTFGRMLRRLLDPNRTDLRAQPREERDLAVASRHGWAVGYDNLSNVPVWLSDALCRVATGGGFSARALYTNDEEAVFDFCRPVIVTSIEDVIGQPDLLDRTLAIELQPIPDHARRPEAALWADFDAARPRVFAGLLDTLARALELLPAVEAEGNPLPRMADFALFAEAVSRSLGAEPGRLLGLLFAARAGADQSALEESVLAKTLYEYVKERGRFVGTYTTLLSVLNAEAGDQTRKAKGWPATAHALSGQVRKISPPLRRLGVEVTHGKTGHAKTRTVTIAYDPEKARRSASAASAPTPDLFADNDLGADAGHFPAASAERPPASAERPQASAARARDADADSPGADAPRTLPASAPNRPSRNGVKRRADAADAVPQASPGHSFTDHPISGPTIEEVL